MNREIKFRAWDKFQKKYIFEGFHICGEVTAFGLMEQVIFETWEERSKALHYTNTIEAWNDFDFEQFINLKDVNKKDIYECDIVSAEDGLYIGQIIYSTFNQSYFLTGGTFSMFTHTWEPKFLKVIGNIHDNPELLTK